MPFDNLRLVIEPVFDPDRGYNVECLTPKMTLLGLRDARYTGIQPGLDGEEYVFEVGGKLVPIRSRLILHVEPV